MLTCEHCQEHLLDHAYGLLEGADLQEMLTHLDMCADCHAALSNALGQKKLMARAARAIAHVPEFALPTGNTVEPMQTAPAPAPEKVSPARAPWRRHWISWVLAASIVVAVAIPTIWYRGVISGYDNGLTIARAELKGIETELAALPAKYEPLHDKAIKDAHAAANPYLHVVGPKTLPANAQGHLHITTRHPEGELAACDLRIKLADAKTGKVIKVERLKSLGHADADFDATGAEPNGSLNLLVEAETTHGMSRLQETLRVQAPTYVTRIDANKTIYQLKDVLFFRVLVLDRITLQPPAAAIPLRVSLVHDKKPIRSLEASTGPGGILAAEFAVEENYADGAYTLEVNPLDAGKTNVQSASLPLEVVRALPDIRLDQARYLPGSTVTGQMTFREGKAVPEKMAAKFDVDGKSIPVNVQPQAAAPGYGGGARGNVGGNGATEAPDAVPSARFSAPIPSAVPAGVNQLQMTLEWGEGKHKKAARTLIPLAPTEFAIDFFPEGGDLIAGVPNRVFYRVRSKTGEPVSGDGRVILLTGKNDILDTHYQLGMGHFDFTPDLQETYTVRITTPAKVENIADPFKKLGGIRSEGVVLHVGRAVGKEDDPICVTLRQNGPARKVLLVAHCRGQIADQRWVEVAPGSVTVALQPTAESRGMIRVTAYETVGNTLDPVAERLVYRAPAQTLHLSFTPNSQQYQPGSTAKATIAAKDENGQPARAWILASVVDERFQTPSRSLSAHFYLLNEIRTGADLDNAQIILNDTPESVQMLERFLGTHGWRRYVAAPGPVREAPLASPLVFSRANMPMAKLQKNYEKKIAAGLAPIHAKAADERKQLETVRVSRASTVNMLADGRARFEEQVQLWIRLGLGAALAVLLAAGLVLMGIGTYRVIRAHKEVTPAFGSAFACLAACVGVVLAANFIGPLPDSRLAKNEPAAPKAMDKLAQLAQGPKVKDSAEKIPTGAYLLERAAKEGEQQRGGVVLAANDEIAAKAAAARALQSQQMVMNVLARDRADAVNLSSRLANLADQKLRDRFEAARASGANAKGSAPQAPVPAPGAGNNARRSVEYPYFFANTGVSDTLLWHPTLLLADGNGAVHFDIPRASATYRVILLGHTPTGRFGFFETRLDVPAFQGR